MNIVFLDAATTQKGDLDWSLFESLGNIVKYDLTSPEETFDRLQDAEIIVTNKVRIQKDHFERSPKLRMIAVLATGYDIIDVAAAKDHDVVVCNIPSYSSASVAQTTFALLLELTHSAGAHARDIQEGKWAESSTFSFWNHQLIELSGKTFAVVGYGDTGERVANIAHAFGMRVIVTSLRNQKRATPYQWLPLKESLSEADVLSLHCPLTESTRGCVSTEWLEQMKRSAFLINTARGGLIDDMALRLALENNSIAGYAADVLSVEPPPLDHPLIGAPNCVLTPHYAWASLESRQRLWTTCAENISAFLKGTPQHVV